jgi:ribA/ribD-fused uncharacterized protein
MDMGQVYYLHTIQLAQWRLARESNVELLDITASSGVAAFAPKMADVMAYKDGQLTQTQYTALYEDRMKRSRTEAGHIWEMLKEHTRVAFACYCRKGEYCHRHMFIYKAKDYLEAEGHTVIIEGELTRPAGKVPFPKHTLPRKKIEIEAFHGKEDLLSNWNPRGFTLKDVYFHTVECFMMYCKAKLMKDDATAELILQERDPAVCKQLGRAVTPYNDALWNEKADGYLVKACLQKAREHRDVYEYLLATKNKIIVEASKSDIKWGAGIAKDDPRIHDPEQWRGENRMGKVWMSVRITLQDEIVF